MLLTIVCGAEQAFQREVAPFAQVVVMQRFLGVDMGDIVIARVRIAKSDEFGRDVATPVGKDPDEKTLAVERLQETGETVRFFLRVGRHMQVEGKGSRTSQP